MKKSIIQKLQWLMEKDVIIDRHEKTEVIFVSKITENVQFYQGGKTVNFTDSRQLLKMIQFHLQSNHYPSIIFNSNFY